MLVPNSYRSTEKDIRDWLTLNGFCGKTAKFNEIELHALKRPGWVQVFRFEFTDTTAENQNVQLFGALYSDERFGKPIIVVSEYLEKRNIQLAEWSAGLITRRRR